MHFPDTKTVMASIVALACVSMLAAPTVFAKGNAQGNVQAGQVAAPTLTVTEAEALLFMREEEKLARDVYLTLYKQWKLPVFNTISGSEQQHTDRVKALLQTYRLADPVTNDTVGVFTNPQLAALYSQLVTAGQSSLLEALNVGAFIEETDIADLQKALAGTTRPDIATVYGNLMRGSRNHLRAFVGQIEAQGVAYTAQALPQAEVDAIINSPTERGQGGQGHGNRQGRGRQ